MSDLAEKLPLTKRRQESTKVEFSQFSKDRIVWNVCEPTVFPTYLLNDPFSTALIKYFNSTYFQVVCKSNNPRNEYRRLVDLYIKIMELEKLTITPPDIYIIFNTYLKELNYSPHQEYRLYNRFRSPARKVSSVSAKIRKKNFALLKNIGFTESEQLALVTANNLAIDRKRPEDGDKSTNSRATDLYEQLNIQDVDVQSFIESLRAFSAFFITEWAGVRESIYRNFPNEISHQLSRARKISKNVDGHMSSNNIHSYERESKEFFNVQLCLDIAKKINHPLLTEMFVLDYLFVHSEKDNRCKIAKNVWNWKEYKSTSSEYDWLSIIEKQYTGSFFKNIKSSICGTRYANYKKLTSKYTYPNIDPDYIGILGAVFPARKILGISISEQVCMSWIMATDRHQPSNMRWMTVGDVAITDNSISTIIDIHTLKKRASVTSGTQYDDLETVFEKDAGGTYKRTQSIFNAIKVYREQVISSAAQGLSQRNNKGQEEDLWFFHDIRTPSHGSTSGGFLNNRHVKFFFKNHVNTELLLCAMEGSLSNKFVLSKCPEAKVFLNQIAKIYEPAPHRYDVDGGRNKSVSEVGVKGMGWHYISRTAVNLKISNRYSRSDIKNSANNNIEVDDKESQLATDRDAAVAFHSKATRNTVYADKLPAYLLDRNDFGARVGDEWIRLAKELSGKKFDNSFVMSLADVRKSLGLQTTAESELEQLNELFGAIEQEKLALDELGLISNKNEKVFIVRHPIIIANIQNQIKVIEQQLDKLEYSNETRMRKAVIKFMYLKMILKEKFTPSELKEAEDIYGDVEFPVGDILI
ncbi:hypothetical protein AB8E32_14830 [Marinomonas polaris]|uniref:hypothetical protein n=1 Tax=Marinomonas polaris TaxID=293552 RepID=UPI003518CED5